MTNISFSFKNKLGNDKYNLVVKGIYTKQKLNSFFDKKDESLVKNVINIEKFDSSYNTYLNIYGDNNVKRINIVGLGDKAKFNSDKLRAIASSIVKKHNNMNITEISIDCESFNLNDKSYAQAFVEGIVLGLYTFNNYKSKVKLKKQIDKVVFIGNVDKEIVNKGMCIGLGVNYSRDLGNHPPNIQTPTFLANEAMNIAKSKNMKSIIFDVKEFKKMGMGSFFGVAMGAETPAKMILVEYNGSKNKKDSPLALVGKGLTFDSGGISLKPPAKMDEMKFDMCGSATVLGVMKAVSKIQPEINIIFAIGATENMPGGKAQRPGDIVTAYNGKTIEVLNTDAEGRLVLADVLSYVIDKYKPNSVIDFATLTGAVLVALGDRSSGVMGNDKKLMNEIQKSSDSTGERVWELPMWEEYSKDIKSNIADIKNLGRAGLAGTISAGAFLKEFVGDTPWVHMDIAGTAWGPKEPSYMPKNGATGVAVRLIYDLIENRL